MTKMFKFYQEPSRSGCEAIQKYQVKYEMSILEGQIIVGASGQIQYLQGYTHYNIRVRAVNEQNVIGPWATFTLRTISTGDEFK